MPRRACRVPFWFRRLAGSPAGDRTGDELRELPAGIRARRRRLWRRTLMAASAKMLTNGARQFGLCQMRWKGRLVPLAEPELPGGAALHVNPRASSLPVHRARTRFGSQGSIMPGPTWKRYARLPTPVSCTTNGRWERVRWACPALRLPSERPCAPCHRLLHHGRQDHLHDGGGLGRAERILALNPSRKPGARAGVPGLDRCP
jgi:hypothetical protein